ncbi:DUF3017 domain-containing protein [Nocardioides sp. HDW12B]|uniref:DUF3017 domain-containing protein n=1 Tax=Nocardioides sp. HDW12B TaxID=2714939 RepID=UPI00140DAF2C|nr:DUF3017 domain-containing protein [Nocardioides sp. HDW12B]QIK65484.1 DUF3017 domain-containing protein [Nocardioides sp. HDW12B]
MSHPDPGAPAPEGRPPHDGPHDGPHDPPFEAPPPRGPDEPDHVFPVGPLPEGEEDSRPYPQPEHSLAPRKPRTVGGLVYLGVLVATLTGVVVVALGEWRSGLTTIGVAVLVGGMGRLVLPNDNAGMLGIRRKLIDVATLLVLGGSLVVLAAIIPDPTLP